MALHTDHTDEAFRSNSGDFWLEKGGTHEIRVSQLKAMYNAFLAAGGSNARSWAFASRVASSGVNYIGGFYDFAASANDFNPSTTHGVANTSYAAHFMLVQAVGAGGGDTTIRVTGTSINDLAVRTTGDTEDIVVDDAGAAGAYYETVKKWLGQVTIAKISGPDLLCNYGFCKYWDNANTDFNVNACEAVWLGGGNDNSPNILLRHHTDAGWTYNAGAAPTPPTAIADMNTDHVTEIQVRNDEEGAWKRTNLDVDVNGSASEGIIVEIFTNNNQTFSDGTFILRFGLQDP